MGGTLGALNGLSSDEQLKPCMVSAGSHEDYCLICHAGPGLYCCFDWMICYLSLAFASLYMRSIVDIHALICCGLASHLLSAN